MAKVSEMTVGFKEIVPRPDNHNKHFNLEIKVVDLNIESEEDFNEVYKHWMSIIVKNIRKASNSIK